MKLVQWADPLPKHPVMESTWTNLNVNLERPLTLVTATKSFKGDNMHDIRTQIVGDSRSSEAEPPRSHRRPIRGLNLIVVSLSLLLGGCQIGPDALRVASTHYSDAVRVAESEQLLLNLVRLRYRDQPVFMSVGSIATQFELGANASVSGDLVENGPDILGLGAGVNYSERPTISFSLLDGEAFQKRLLSPIGVPAVALLAESGWRSDRVLRLTAESINGLSNAPTASGPTPGTSPEYSSFLEAVRLLQDLDDRGMVDVEFELRREPINDPIPTSQIDGDSLIAAAKLGVEFETSEQGQKVTLFAERLRLVLRFEPDAGESPEVRQLRKLLSIDPAADRVEVVALQDSQFDPFDAEQPIKQIGINTRSLLGVLYYLSTGVNPPDEHYDRGLVTRTRNATGEVFDWELLLDDIFQVHCSRTRPSGAAVAVRYRGQWFYIDDADQTSKSTFLLLKQIFALQAGEVEDINPVLTLPVN